MLPKRHVLPYMSKVVTHSQPVVCQLNLKHNPLKTPKLYSISNAAALLGCSRRTVWRRIAQKKLVPLRIPGQTFVILKP